MSRPQPRNAVVSPATCRVYGESEWLEVCASPDAQNVLHSIPIDVSKERQRQMDRLLPCELASNPALQLSPVLDQPSLNLRLRPQREEHPRRSGPWAIEPMVSHAHGRAHGCDRHRAAGTTSISAIA